MLHDKSRRRYEAPTVEAVHARQLMEALGPAHCQYGGNGGGNGEGSAEVRVIRGGSGRWHRR